MTKTPPRAVLPPELDQGLKSTPWSAGSASHESYQTQNTQEHYKPYLTADITGATSIPFEDFLRFVFAFDSSKDDYESAFHAIATSPCFGSLLDEYKDYVGHKTERYRPFNNLANYIIAELEKRYPSEEELIFLCRNDHILVEGSSASRSPDCVVVPVSAMGHGKRTSFDNLSKDGPKTNPFHWCELLAFVEFKLENQELHSLSSVSLTEAATTTPTHHHGKVTSLSSSKVKKSNRQFSNRGSSRGSNRALATPPTPTSHSVIASAVLLSPAAPILPSPHSSAGTSSQKRKEPDLQIPSQKRQRRDNDPPILRQDTLVQCASYALEMLSHGGLRSHVFGVLITDNNLELLYYDRSLPVHSDPVCFLKNPASLVAFLYCMRHLTFSQWGHVIRISPSPPTLNPLQGAQLKLNNGTILELGGLIFRQHALIGRGTCVIRASVKTPQSNDPWSGKSLIVKFSFTPNDRMAEGNILDKITTVAKSDCVHHWVLDHLPEVLHYEAFLADATFVQKRLSGYLKAHGIQYESRAPQVLVMTELFSITELTTMEMLIPAISGVFDCYRWVYQKAGFIHRDISLNNIMLRKKAPNLISGVLSDFDLSIPVERMTNSPSSKQRTGTKPYMAIDLLQHPPPTHLYRHDLESLFYVIVILTSRYHEGRELTENPPLQAWFDLGADDLLDKKVSFMMNRGVPQPTLHFQKIEGMISSMRKMFRDAFAAQADHTDNINKMTKMVAREKQAVPEFDESTLGGHINFDKFHEILKEAIK